MELDNAQQHSIGTQHTHDSNPESTQSIDKNLKEIPVHNKLFISKILITRVRNMYHFDLTTLCIVL